MKRTLHQQGFSLIMVFIVIVVVAGLAFAGWYVWQKNKSDTSKETGKKSFQNNKDKSTQDETAHWTLVSTQDEAFSMRIPDGWVVGSYPGDFLGALDVTYKPGTAAIINTEKDEYIGHALRFRASITELDDAGLGPQWESPQPGLQESMQAFSIGNLEGKRFQAKFTGDLDQTLYEYVFDLGNNKRLDIVYTIYHTENQKDDVGTVEKAIKTIKLKQ